MCEVRFQHMIPADDVASTNVETFQAHPDRFKRDRLYEFLKLHRKKKKLVSISLLETQPAL